MFKVTFYFILFVECENSDKTSFTVLRTKESTSLTFMELVKLFPGFPVAPVHPQLGELHFFWCRDQES